MDEDDIMCYLCIGLIVFLIISGIIICNDNARYLYYPNVQKYAIELIKFKQSG